VSVVSVISLCRILSDLGIGGGYPWKREAEAEPKGPVAECFGNGCEFSHSGVSRPS
jgi:hypothetical protein